MNRSTFRKIRTGFAIITAFAIMGSGMFGYGAAPFLKIQSASAETYSISGTVLAPDGATPVNGAHPYAQTLDRMQFYPGNQTGSDGAYTIANIPPGNYIVGSNPPDGMAGVTRSNDIMVTISSSNITQNITLNGTPKTITGTITYRGTTTPVVGVVVNAWSNNNGMGGGGQATTDASGAYSLSLPASAQYGMNLNASAGADWSYNEPQYMVSFASDNSTESRTVNFQVTKATATITGSVTYASNGATVNGGNMNAWSTNGAGGGGNAQVINGAYTMRVPAGVFNVNYWNEDQSLTATPTMVSVLDNQTVTANIVIKQKTAHLTGKTVDVNGTAVAGIRMHAWCQPLGTSNQDGGQAPGINGNDESDSNGTFDLAILSGICNINVDQGGMGNQSGPTYVMSSNIPQVTLETDTTSKDIGNVAMVLADATIRVTVKDEAGAVVTGINGYINAQKAGVDQFGPGQNFGGSLQPDGTATIKLPSSVFSLVKLNMFMGQDSQYSISDVGSTVTISANSTTNVVLTLVRNNSSIYGSLVDNNGVPLTKCTPPAGKFSFGEVFVNNPKTNTGRNAQFKEDCSFRVSLTAGQYNFNWHFSDGSGLLNGNPSPDLVKVTAGQNVVKNITALIGDANIKVRVVDPTGMPMTNTWVDASNEIELFGQPGGSGPQNGPQDLAGSGVKDKNGKSGDAFQICSDAIKKKDAKQIKMCKETKLPDIAQGPGGCKNIYDCVTYCSKPANQTECGKFKGQQSGNQQQTGPGGCKTESECKTYCSKPANQQECMKFGPATGQMSGAGFFKGKVKGATTNQGDKAMGGGPSADDFKNVLRSGGMTDNNGNLTISVISGHKYEVRANPQQGSPYMPAKSQVVDFTKSKSTSLTLALRQADAKITGTVSGGGPMGFCHAYSDDNSFSGGEVRNGRYEINVSKGVWHVGCDSAWDNNFARADEVLVIVDGSKKTITQNFKLSANSNFRIPPAYSTTFDSTTAQSIVLEDGTSLIIPASALATSGNITLTATPTANLQSTSGAKAAWYGYQFEAKDSNGATITKFNSNVTVIFKYTDAMLEASGVDENALLPRYWDESTNSWQTPDNVTQNTSDNSITISTDHFSKHALTYSAAAVSKVSVTKGTGKNLGKVTMNKKTVTAFAGTKLNVATAVYGGSTGQLVFVSPADSPKKGDSVIKVYNAKTGKQVKTLNPYGGKTAINLALADLTKDGKSDLTASQTSNSTVKVYDAAKKYKGYSVNTGAERNSTLTVASLEAQQTGYSNLSVLIQKNKNNDVKVYKFTGKGFNTIAGLDENNKRIKVSGTSLSLVILNPTIKKITGSIKTTSVVSMITLTGENFTPNTVVTIQGDSISKMKYISSTKIQVTVNGTTLTKGKAAISLVNEDGGKSNYTKFTVK